MKNQKKMTSIQDKIDELEKETAKLMHLKEHYKQDFDSLAKIAGDLHEINSKREAHKEDQKLIVSRVQELEKRQNQEHDNDRYICYNLLIGEMWRLYGGKK